LKQELSGPEKELKIVDSRALMLAHLKSLQLASYEIQDLLQKIPQSNRAAFMDEKVSAWQVKVNET